MRDLDVEKIKKIASVLIKTIIIRVNYFGE